VNPLLGAAGAWALLVLVLSITGWLPAWPALAAIADAWAAAPGGSWSLALAAGTTEALFLAAGFAVAALGAGDAAALFRRKLPAVLAIPLGLGVLAAAVAGCGFAGLYTAPVLRVLALAALAGGLMSLLARRAAIGGFPGALKAPPAATAAALLIALAVAAALASLPDTLEDAFVYHWAAPEAFLREGRIYAAVHHFQWHGPLGVEMLFAVGLAVAGVAGIKAVNLVLIVTAVAGAGALARRLVPRAGGWVAAVLLALAPAIVGQAWEAKNDVGAVVFWTAALLAMLGRPAGSSAGALLAGGFAGLCASVKYTSLFPLAGLAVWFLLRRPGRRTVLLAGAAAVLAISPWLVRNWLATRDPVYPIASSWIGGLFWGPPYARSLHNYARQVTPERFGRPEYWLLGWYDALASPEQLGVALAILGPIGLAAFLPRAALAACAASVVAFLALLAERNTRFLLPLAPLAAAGGEAALLALRGVRPRLAESGWSLLAGLATLHLLVRLVAGLPAQEWPAVAGRLSPRDLLAARYTAFDETRGWCASRLPENARILLTGSHQRFGFRQSVVSTHVVTMPLPWRWAHESRTPGELAKKWKQAGIGFVVHNLVSARFRHQGWFIGPPWTDRALGVYRAFGLRYLTEVHRSPRLDGVNGFFYVLRVDRAPHPPARAVPVLPWTESVFAEVRVAGNRRSPPATCLALADRALARLPDVDDAIEQAAHVATQYGQFNRALPLNRAVAADGFDGETGWHELAVSESYLGRRPAAFAALRQRVAVNGPLDPDINKLAATVFLNLAGARALKGDISGACRLLEIALRIQPGFQLALDGSAELGCGVPRTSREPVR